MKKVNFIQIDAFDATTFDVTVIVVFVANVGNVVPRVGGVGRKLPRPDVTNQKTSCTGEPAELS